MPLTLRILAPALLILLASPATFAGGGSIVNGGGSSVVCFSIPVSEAMNHGRITPQGAENIRSAQVLEYYLASLKRNHSSPFFAAIKANDPDRAWAYLDGLIAMVPEFSRRFAEKSRILGQVGDGIAVPTALNPLADSDLVIDLPEGCAQVQTVIRRNLGFFYDAAVWDALGRQDGLQQKILQLHEVVYEMSSIKQHSSPTQALLIAMMSDPMDKRILTKRMAEALFNTSAILFGNQLVDSIDNRSIRLTILDFYRQAIAAKPDSGVLQALLNSLRKYNDDAPADPEIWTAIDSSAEHTLQGRLKKMISITSIQFDAQAYSDQVKELTTELQALLMIVDN